MEITPRSILEYFRDLPDTQKDIYESFRTENIIIKESYALGICTNCFAQKEKRETRFINFIIIINYNCDKM